MVIVTVGALVQDTQVQDHPKQKADESEFVKQGSLTSCGRERGVPPSHDRSSLHANHD